jgi:hypothetical protein
LVRNAVSLAIVPARVKLNPIGLIRLLNVRFARNGGGMTDILDVWDVPVADIRECRAQVDQMGNSSPPVKQAPSDHFGGGGVAEE